MESTLPPNILSYIGTFLEEKNRLACALACKHWKEPFLNAYWGKLDIGEYGMDITTLDSNEQFLINVHRVWAANFFDVQLSDYEYFPKLQRFFPGIRYFQFYDLLSDISTISEAFNWSLWQSLLHLHISFKHDCETVSLQSLFMKLSVLPCLVHFTLHQPSIFSSQYTLSWNDFESLHYNLPRLEYPNHSFLLKPITRDEIESIKTVDSAQTTTKIEFNDKVDTLWLFYLALKYPNLQHLTIQEISNQSNNNPIDYSDQQYQPDLQLLSTLDQFFPCLKAAVTNLQTSNLYSLFTFYGALGHFGTEAEYVELKYNSALMENDDIKICIHPISESLKVLRIEFYFDEDEDPKPTAITFDAYPKIVELLIGRHMDFTIEVDNILENFPSLRSLTVERTKFSLSSNTHSYTPHPLQRLEIRYSNINNDALNHVSSRCNQLKFVNLVDIGYNGVGETGQLVFDMSMAKLDTFIFTFSDGILYNLQTFPRHYMFQQLGNDNNILQTAQQPYRINWYHVYCDRTNRQERILKWELGRRDIEFCQRYFKDFGRRKNRGKERRDIKEDEYGYVQKRFWKKDLKYGVLIFRLKSVKNYFFRIK